MIWECVVPRNWIVYAAIGADMRRIDALFLASVFVVASAFSWMSLSNAVRSRPTAAPSHSASIKAAGEARDVDMDRLQQMLRQGDLSEREAEFYKPLPAPVSSQDEAR